MKTLIRHLWRNNRDEIVARSCRNCHCRGLNSIMLIDKPGARVRIFFATENHELDQNGLLTMGKHGLSVAFHPHHCNVTLHCIMGMFMNWRVAPYNNEEEHLTLTKFRYASKLAGASRASFQKLEEAKLCFCVSQWLRPGESEAMKATDLHTVNVETGQRAAWFVYEGQENPDYQPICYSNAALDEMDFGHLYQPIGASEVESNLVACELL